MSKTRLKDLQNGDMFILKSTGTEYTVGYLGGIDLMLCKNLDTFENVLLPLEAEVEVRMLKVKGARA